MNTQMIHITQYPIITKYNDTLVIIHKSAIIWFAPPSDNPQEQSSTATSMRNSFSAKTTDRFTNTLIDPDNIVAHRKSSKLKQWLLPPILQEISAKALSPYYTRVQPRTQQSNKNSVYHINRLNQIAKKTSKARASIFTFSLNKNETTLTVRCTYVV